MMLGGESSGRIGGELVCVVFPDGQLEVAVALDDRGTVDLDCLHPHALGLQEEVVLHPHQHQQEQPTGDPLGPSISSSSLFARAPLRIGRDVMRPSRSDPWAPLLPRRRYRLLLPPSSPVPLVPFANTTTTTPFHATAASRRPSLDAAAAAALHQPLPHQPYPATHHQQHVETQELREVKALLRSLLAAASNTTSTSTTSTTATGSISASMESTAATSSSSPSIDEGAADRIPASFAATSASVVVSEALASPATVARSLASAPPALHSPLPACRHVCGEGAGGGDAGVPSGSGEGKRTKRKDSSKQKRAEVIDSTPASMDNGEASGEIVRVNVGGKEFITLRSTLCRFDGTFLEAVFSGRHRSVRDSMGRCFIDRNPQHFQVILDFLRDPTMTCPELPSQKEERQAFLREVEYYGLKEVMVGEKKEAELLCEQGYAFYNGRKVSKDYRKAVELWQRAAELGEARAQNRLAMCYKNGEGVEQDLYKAIPLFQKAAEQGLRDAQYNLACIYKNGEGVGVDLQKAVLWFRRAEAQGDTDARRMLETLASLASASASASA